MMKYLILFLGSLVITNQSVSQCESRHYFSHSDRQCYFDISYINSECTEFSFIECGFLVCTIGVDSDCDQWDWSSSKVYGQCTRKCCDQTKPYQMNSNALQQCQQYLDQMYTLRTIIIVSIIVGMLILFGVVTYCCKHGISGSINNIRECSRRCRSCFCRKRQEEMDEDLYLYYRQSIQNPYFKANVWVDVGENNYPESICSICLEEDPKLMLKCRHLFHPNCLQTWLAQKRQCSLCRSGDMSDAVLWCNRCCKKWKKVNVDYIGDWLCHDCLN